MKTFLCALVMCLSLLGQQVNSLDVTLCVNGDCDGNYQVNVPSLAVQVSSIWCFAHYEVWACLSGPVTPTPLCFYTYELELSVGVFCIDSGTLSGTGFGQSVFMTTLPFPWDITIQAFVVIPNQCGFAVSSAVFVQP